MRKFFSLVFLFMVLTIRTAYAENTFTIHYPPDKIIKEYGLLGISFSVKEGTADRVIIKVNNEPFKDLDEIKKINDFSVHIEPGTNTIEFVALKENALVDRVSRCVFLRSDLVGAYKQWPPDYRKDNFHSRKQELCAECHQMDPTEADKKPVISVSRSSDNSLEVQNEKQSTCYSCHKGILSYAYVHGPASVWSCLSCHDEKSSPRYIVEKPETKSCFKCHLDKQKLWMNKKYKHGPVTLGKCTICHSPHSARYPFNLYKRTWDLCVNCHFELGAGRHVLGDSFSQGGHPTKDKDDPVRLGRELTCASCHDPHASDFPHMFAFEVENLFDLCQKCHDKKVDR